MPAYVVRRSNWSGSPTEGGRRLTVLVLGIAYKKNTNDARETPADPIIRGLRDLGAEVVVHDDHVGPNVLDLVAERVALTDSEVARADAVVLVTDHDDVDYDLVAAHGTYVFDTRRRMHGDTVELL